MDQRVSKIKELQKKGMSIKQACKQVKISTPYYYSLARKYTTPKKELNEYDIFQKLINNKNIDKNSKKEIFSIFSDIGTFN